MRRRSVAARIAVIRVRVHEAVHLANVYLGGVLNWRNPVPPALPLHCEHIAYTAGRHWLAHTWRAVYALF